MSQNPIENKFLQNPEFHGYWAEYFPRVVRMGVLGALAVSAAILVHEKFSNKPTESIPVQDQSSPNDQAA